MTGRTVPAPSPGHRRGGVALAGVLSLLLPGLGHVFARAWPLGVALLGVSVAATVALRGVTTVRPPTPPVVTAWLALLAVAVALSVGTALDAMRRARRRFARPTPPWWRSTWLAAALVVALQIGLDAALPFGWRSFSQSSSSMNPGQAAGDVFLADIHGDRPVPARGDVVLFTLPDEPDMPYVKRVVAVAGDTVAVRSGTLLLNGHPVPHEADGPVTVGVAGNERPARAFVERLPGTAGYRIARLDDAGPAPDLPPTTIPPGTLFVLGDSRDTSLDSRNDEIGPVRVENVVAVGGTFIWSHVEGRVLTAVR